MEKITFSFDFDGTLNDSEGLQRYCAHLVKNGHTVKILTRRYGPEANYKEDEHTYVYYLASELGVQKENVHFTNRKLKYEFVDQLGIQAHIDDDVMDCRYIKMETKCFPILFSEAHNWQEQMNVIVDGKFSSLL